MMADEFRGLILKW